MLIRGLGSTWRLRSNEPPPLGGTILAVLHGCLLLPLFSMRRYRPIAMISQHSDGEIIAQAVHRLGYGAVRGSSTRGGVEATRQLLRDDDRQRPWVVTPDGPKGPRGSAKPGLIRIASMSGRTICPVAAAARPAKRFSSWDRFILPMPFARVAVHYGAPLVVPPRIRGDAIETLRREFEERLVVAEKAAIDALASW